MSIISILLNSRFVARQRDSIRILHNSRLQCTDDAFPIFFRDLVEFEEKNKYGKKEINTTN